MIIECVFLRVQNREAVVLSYHAFGIFFIATHLLLESFHARRH